MILLIIAVIFFTIAIVCGFVSRYCRFNKFDVAADILLTVDCTLEVVGWVLLAASLL